MKKQQLYTLILALGLIVFVALACGNTGKDVSSGGDTGKNTAPFGRSSNSGDGGLSTPTESHAAMYQAMKARDISAYKKTLSKCYLDRMAGFAKQQNISLDDFIKNSIEIVPAASIKEPQVRNEKISGNTASLEEKDFTGGDKWNLAPYIKESDGWKFNALCNGQ